MNPQNKSKRHWLYIILGVAGLFLLSPQLKAHVKKIEKDVAVQGKQPFKSTKPMKAPQGESLFKAKCAMCHSLTSEQLKAAPAMSDIVVKYQSVYGQDGQSRFIEFAQNPHSQPVIMDKAVDRFGRMPKMGYNQADLKEIVKYLWPLL